MAWLTAEPYVLNENSLEGSMADSGILRVFVTRLDRLDKSFYQKRRGREGVRWLLVRPECLCFIEENSLHIRIQGYVATSDEAF